MDGIGGTIKNQVFREVKSGRIVVESPHDFSVYANRIVEAIATNEEVYVWPIDIEEALYIKGTFEVRKLIEKSAGSTLLVILSSILQRANCLYQLLSCVR